MNWLDEHIKEVPLVEEFFTKRMICLYCGMKIGDDKYVIMCHPDRPDESLHQIYFHSKGECNPRQRLLKQRKERWLKQYEYQSQKNH